MAETLRYVTGRRGPLCEEELDFDQLEKAVEEADETLLDDQRNLRNILRFVNAYSNLRGARYAYASPQHIFRLGEHNRFREDYEVGKQDIMNEEEEAEA